MDPRDPRRQKQQQATNQSQQPLLRPPPTSSNLDSLAAPQKQSLLNDPRQNFQNIQKPQPQNPNQIPHQTQVNQQQTRPSHKRPQTPPEERGPPRRNKHLQEQDPDLFQPRYALAFDMPSIPVKPKLFKYRLDPENTAAAYEFSSIELNAEDQCKLLVDYNMGARIDLIDRQVYAGGQAAKGGEISEIDKFLLSDSDKLPDFAFGGEQGVGGTGGVFEDKVKHAHEKALQLTKQHTSQVAAPILTQQRSSQMMRPENIQNTQLVMTGEKSAKKIDLAKKQIELSFTQAKEMKIGSQKIDPVTGEPVYGVRAKAVHPILPSQLGQLMQNQFSLVVNDDDIGQTKQFTNQLSNGQVMYSFNDDIDGEPRKALYTVNATQSVTKEFGKSILGKRVADKNISAIQLEHLRDYSYAESIGGTKGESHDYVLIDCPQDGTKRYIPIQNKVKLNKKRKANPLMHGNDEDMQEQQNRQKHAKFLLIAPRGIGHEEARQFKDKLQTSGLGQEYKFVSNNANVMFESKESLIDAEKEAAKVLKKQFKPVTSKFINSQNQTASPSKKQVRRSSINDDSDELKEIEPEAKAKNQDSPMKEDVEMEEMSEDSIF